MKIFKNILIPGPHQRPILLDVYAPESHSRAPVVIFAHGFKGFKDWGPFPLVAQEFASAGFIFVKLNFSHNGTTPENPLHFEDLEAFGHNNYTKEMDDLGAVIDWIGDPNPEKNFSPRLDRLYLLGHSRGGGIAILKAAEDPRVQKLATWASVHHLGRLFEDPKLIENWKKEGVVYIDNARTKQQMPIYWQMYEDYEKNFPRFDIATQAKTLQLPYFIVHGKRDETVPYVFALDLKEWAPRAKLLTLETGNHTFGASHPWNEPTLPQDLNDVVQETISFFQK